MWFSSDPASSEFHELNRIICLNARAVARRQRQVLEKPKKATFYQNEIYHATKFSEIVIFKCPSVLRIVLLWQESVFLTHEWWPRNNGKYLKNWRSQFFSKRDLPCTWVFWSCEFSGVPVFSETHEFNKSLCFTLQAVAQKQRQILFKLKKDSFLKMRVIIQLICVMLRFLIVLVFSEKHGFSNIPCVNVRAVAKKQRKMFEQIKKLVFLERSFCFV